jgi:ABC-type transporter Mla MlaB component
VADEVLRISKVEGRPGLVIAGEIDEAGYPVLLQCLAALDTGGEVHVDLAAVEFCDLAGLRAIVTVGRPEEQAGPGRDVCLHAVPSRLRNILHILGWDETPGLTFDELSLARLTDTADLRRCAPDPVDGHKAPEQEQPAC